MTSHFKPPIKMVGLTGDVLADTMIQATVREHPFQTDRQIKFVPAGMSVTEITEQLWTCDRPCSIRADGYFVPMERRDDVRPRETIEIVGVPGQKVLKVVAQVVIAVAAVVATAVATSVGGPILGAIVGGLVGAAGNLAVNALFPTATPQLSLSAIGASGLAGAISAGSASRSSSSGVEGSPTYSIGGARNDFSPYGPVPVNLGKNRVSPAYAAQIYTINVGNEQFLRAIFCWGHGDLSVSDLSIGETSIDNFEDVKIDTQSNWQGDISPSLFPNQVFQEDLNIRLDPSVQNLRTTADDVDELAVDISAPNGLYRYQKSDGNRVARTVTFRADYRLTGTSAWTNFIYTNLTAGNTTAIRRTYRAVVAPGQYDVRVIKISADYVGEDVVSEAMVWTGLQSQRNRSPISIDYPITISTVEIKATAQLSGVVETFNGICVAKVTSWDGSAWVASTESENPADLFRHVLQSAANKRPVPDAEIDLDTLADWADYCRANGFTFNQYRDFKASVPDTLRDITSAGRAVALFKDGKWSVVWDDAGAPVVQHFTPGNSSGFSGSRAYLDVPHGFRVRFVNAEKSWQQDERIVYDDGYDETNATLLEGVEFPGVTDPDLIWKHGRYHIAQLRLRRESYELTTDFEHLVCTRGDRVRVSHDVPKWGLGFGRVKSVVGETVTLSGTVSMLVDGTYTVRFRLADGSSSLRSVVTEAGAVSDITLVADAGELAPEPGDIFQFGETDLESVVLRVLSISPGADFSARMVLVDDAPDIFNADTGTIPAFDSQITDPINYFDLPPTGLLVSESYQLGDGGLQSVANLSWVAPEGPVTGYLVQYRVDSSSEWSDPIAVMTTATAIDELLAGSYRFRVKAVFGSLLSGWSQEIALDAVGAFVVPPSVENFRATVSGSNLLLTWDAINDLAVRGFEIRFTKALGGATWPSSATTLSNAQGTSAVLPFAKGTYSIKAVTYNAIASDAAAFISVNVEPLSAVNAVETASDDGVFDGTYERVYFDGVSGGLVLDNAPAFFTGGQFFTGSQFFSGTPGHENVGYYTLADIVDLSAVMTARLSSEITVGGLQLNSKYFTGGQYFSGSKFFSADPDQWDLTTEVRTTDDDPNVSPAWSDWAEFIAADYSARGFQFRLKLESSSPLITPLVTGATFTIDMPDRILADGDVQSTVDGLTITFSPAFLAVKAVNITPQNLATGDYYTVTHDDTQFTANIFNAAGTKIDVPFDYQVIGYGSTSS